MVNGHDDVDDGRKVCIHVLSVKDNHCVLGTGADVHVRVNVINIVLILYKNEALIVGCAISVVCLMHWDNIVIPVDQIGTVRHIDSKSFHDIGADKHSLLVERIHWINMEFLCEHS